MRHTGLRRAGIALLFVMLAPAAGAQQLSVRWYGTQDGLTSSDITSILQDSRGYLWIGTVDGVSRFDGTSFVNYRPPDLPEPLVWSVAEDPRGGIWVGTNGAGVARLVGTGSGAGQRHFQPYRLSEERGANAVDDMAFDGHGHLWCVTDAGLYRADIRTEPLHFEKLVARSGPSEHLAAFAQGPDHLWFGLDDRLIEAAGDRIVRHPLPPEYAAERVFRIRSRADGTLLVALSHELLELTTMQGRDTWRSHHLALHDEIIESLAETSGGTVWVGTTRRLIREGAERKSFDTTAGIPSAITTLFPDRSGRLWMGTRLGGIGRLSTNTLVAFSRGQGLPHQTVPRLAEGLDGRIAASTWGGPVIIRDDVVARVRGGGVLPFRDISRRLACDRFGNWWIGTRDGLFFLRGPDFDVSHALRVGQREGLPAGGVVDGPGLRVDDERVCVVIGESVYRAPLKADAPGPFERIATSPGLDALDVLADGRGRVWMATFDGLVRVTSGGLPALERTEPFDSRDLLRDSRGWFWIGRRGRGVAIAKQPDAPHPVYQQLTTADGLSSDTVWTVADAGRFVFLGTGRGLDRYDTTTGTVDNLLAINAVAPAEVFSIIVDRRSRIWAGTSNGILRFDPPIEIHALAPPAVFITTLRLNGEPAALPPLAAAAVSAPRMAASRSDLTIEYASVDIDRTEPVRYEHRLSGVDAAWSAPAAERVVSYPRLPPGHYAFEVRGLTREGTGPIATVALTVEPALWQRWWFIALSVGTLIAGALAVQRVRLGRVIALERVRRQIASDLHDDLGSGLAQIAVLAEVAQRGTSEQRAPVMADVADIARSLRSSVSEIVWAVDPRYDRLGDLVVHMREIAVSLLDPAGIALTMSVAVDETTTVPPDRRRQVTLFFKEAMANIARHAGATSVIVAVRTIGDALLVSIEDNGRGFDPASRRAGGHGLDNMHARASSVGGRLTIDSAPGSGARMTFACPLR